MRRNGFEWPPDPLQMSSWLVFLSYCSATGLLVVPVLPGASAWVFAAVYGLLSLALAVATVRTTASDASDPLLLAACRPSGHDGEKSPTAGWCGGRRSAPTVAPAPLEPNNFCYICKVEVYRRSKHCKLCKKCVGAFDHHCVWLNNCIGESNYRLFLSTLACAMAHSTAQSAGTAAALVVVLGQVESEWTGALSVAAERQGVPPGESGLGRIAYASLLGVLLLVTLPTIALVGQLAWFHIGLMREGLTTYDYILREQARAAERGSGESEITLGERVQGIVKAISLGPLSRRGLRRTSATHGESDAQAGVHKSPGGAGEGHSALDELPETQGYTSSRGISTTTDALADAAAPAAAHVSRGSRGAGDVYGAAPRSTPHSGVVEPVPQQSSMPA